MLVVNLGAGMSSVPWSRTGVIVLVRSKVDLDRLNEPLLGAGEFREPVLVLRRLSSVDMQPAWALAPSGLTPYNSSCRRPPPATFALAVLLRRGT